MTARCSGIGFDALQLAYQYHYDEIAEMLNANKRSLPFQLGVVHYNPWAEKNYLQLSSLEKRITKIKEVLDLYGQKGQAAPWAEVELLSRQKQLADQQDTLSKWERYIKGSDAYARAAGVFNGDLQSFEELELTAQLYAARDLGANPMEESAIRQKLNLAGEEFRYRKEIASLGRTVSNLEIQIELKKKSNKSIEDEEKLLASRRVDLALAESKLAEVLQKKESKH